jgi:hypothetical protein
VTPFGVLLGVLLTRNAFLFSTPEYERADMGANSILIEQARRFSLLLGNYSREGFNHPGPAFLYVESWGESVFWAALRVVPAAWNGQLIGLYVLNALFGACVVAVAYGWTRSLRGALAAGAAVACFAAVHPEAFSSDWMPYVYVPAFLLFVVSAASAAAGRGSDAWIAALSGWFLIHGHAAFLVIVPALVLVLAALRLVTGDLARRTLGAAVARVTRRNAWDPAPRTSPRDEDRDARPRILARWRTWLPVVAISAVFLLPMVLQLALHGDGNFARYFGYASSSDAGGHTAAQVTDYVLWYWWPRAHAWAAPVVLVLLAGLLTWRLPAGPARRFCRWLMITDAAAVALVVVYVAVGVDSIDQHYICYFSWATPAVLLLVITIAVTGLLASARPRRGALTALALAYIAAVAACCAFAGAAATQISTAYVDPLNPPAGNPVDPALPAAVATMGTLAAGRTIVLDFPHDGWTDVTGILVQAGRTGVSACVADPHWAFLMSGRSICTTAEFLHGYIMSVYPDGEIPPAAYPVARLQRAIVTAGTN